ncbi:MAG: helix-turn-helix domain-containing protein [Thermodesulfobacteriota bacterium]
MEPHINKMNMEEVSIWLHILRTTVYHLCRRGEIPCSKIGGHWRFHQQQIEVWLVRQAIDNTFGVRRKKPGLVSRGSYLGKIRQFVVRRSAFSVRRSALVFWPKDVTLGTRVTGYELRTTNHEPRATRYEIRDTR